MNAKGWLWKKDAANLYDAFIIECISLDDFPISGASLIRRTPQTDETKPAHKALNELMLDCFKKVRESKNKRKRAAAREDIAADQGGEVADAGDNEGPVRAKRPKYDDGRPIVVYILDPEDPNHRDPTGQQWHWSLPGVKKLLVLYESSLNDLHLKISPYLPVGRKVREVIGALDNVSDATKLPSDTSRIQSDEGLDAFLRLTEAKPIKLLIILHRQPGGGANTPVAGAPPNYYFAPGRFDGPEYYIDEMEDSEEEISKRAGGKKGVPRKDHKFEERLEDIRRRIRRQQGVLASLEAKHKAAFPGAIHDADQGGDLRTKCYGVNDDLTGDQVIKFRLVIAAYLADVTARGVANAGGALTQVQIDAAALVAVKADIDANVYPGLPQTA